MFSNATVGILMGLGLGAWVYNKAYKSNGGNSQNALILAAASAFGTFLVIVTLLSIFFH